MLCRIALALNATTVYNDIITELGRNVKKIMKISEAKYLKKVFVVFQDKEQLEKLVVLKEKLQKEGIGWKVLEEAEMEAEEQATVGVLYITDCRKTLDRLNALGLAVLVSFHSGNEGEDLSTARYAVEQTEEVETIYLERVYRRYAGIPWYILETEHLFLRESVPEDAEDFCKIYQEPAITQYMESLAESKVSNPDYFRQYAKYVYDFYEFGIWTVILKETGQVIGRVGFSMREEFELPQLGYVIGAPWQGRGFAKEACEGVLKYAQEELGFEQIQVLIQTHNIPSLNLACQLGFIYERNLHIEEKKYELLVKNYTY